MRRPPKHEHVDPYDDVPVSEELEEGNEEGVPPATDEALHRDDDN